MKKELRALLLKSKFYRFAALVFAVCGVAVFAFMYYHTTNEDALAVLKNPYIVLILVISFLPAFVLSWQAVRYEKKLIALLESKKETSKDVREGEGVESQKNAA